MSEPVLKGIPEPAKFTIHYSDGSREEVTSGLLARKMPQEGVEILALNTTPPDFLVLLAALESSVDSIILKSD